MSPKSLIIPVPHHLPTATQEHPDLQDLCIIDKLSNQRINPNSSPFQIENEYVTGKMIIMIRTSDADKKTKPIFTGGSISNDEVSNYFRSKKRRFEIQIQVKFKKSPQSPMYLCIEHDEPMKLNVLSRASLNALLKFTQIKLPLMSYLLNRKEDINDTDTQTGRYENPHFAAPIDNSLDRIVVTKKGETPPCLGVEIHEDPTERKRRIHKGGIEYNTENTYTFCVYSAYLDYLQWAFMVPGLPKISLTNFLGPQPINVRIYSLKSTNNEERHLQSDMELWLDVEVNYLGVTNLGKGAKKWIEKCLEESSIDSHQSFASYYTTLMEFENGNELYAQRPHLQDCCRLC